MFDLVGDVLSASVKPTPVVGQVLDEMQEERRKLVKGVRQDGRKGLRSVPHGDDVVFSTDATGRPAIATGPSE
jgi:hypothetical protein